MKYEAFKLLWSDSMSAAAAAEGWFLDYWTTCDSDVEDAHIVEFRSHFAESWPHLSGGVEPDMSLDELQDMVQVKASQGSGLHTLAVRIVEATRTPAYDRRRP